MMDDDGQAYIATAVALGALLVATFAAPAISYASLATGTQADRTARGVFFDEVEDVLRLLNETVSDADLSATVDCARSEEEVPIPGDEDNTTTVYNWDCDDDQSCGDEILVEAADDAIDAMRHLVQLSIHHEADLRMDPACVANCDDLNGADTDDADYRPTPEPATAAMDLRIWFTAPSADASFDEAEFGGEHAVDVTCNNTPP